MAWFSTYPGQRYCEGTILGHPFAWVEGADFVLRNHTDLLARLRIAEDGPELSTITYGAISDLLTPMKGKRPAT